MFRYPKRKLRKLISRGEYEEAAAFGRSLEPEFGDDPDYLFIMGSLFYIVEDDRECVSYLDRALRALPGDTEALQLKTNAHLRLGEREEARRCCDQILESDPGNGEAARIRAQL